MPVTMKKRAEACEHAVDVEKLSIEQQLQLAAANFSGTLESQLTATAVAAVISRMVQLDEDDQRDLFECLKDLATIKTREDAKETMRTILEILEPGVAESYHSERGLISDGIPSRQKHESWLVWISEKLKNLREQRNLTQQELAQKAGIRQSHISRLEQGLHSPSMKTLERLAKALGVDVGSLTLLSE